MTQQFNHTLTKYNHTLTERDEPMWELKVDIVTVQPDGKLLFQIPEWDGSGEWTSGYTISSFL